MGFIPVQSTAKSSRLYKMRGSRVAIQGRSRLGARLITQLTVADDDDEGAVRYKLPAQKARQAHPHSLSASVKANKRSIKKH